MATPIVERRKVIIEYENRITGDLGSMDGNQTAGGGPRTGRGRAA